MIPVRSALLLVLAASAAHAADPEALTIDAFSIWTGSGAVVATGPHAHVFAGEMRGPYFIDAGEGPIPAGEIVCVGSLEANDLSGVQAGSAQCRLQAVDGAVAFGRFSCAGYRLVGCSGTFELTGGEGRMTGAGGEGPIVLRRYETALTPSGDGSLAEQAIGVASWKGFTLTFPSQPPQ